MIKFEEYKNLTNILNKRLINSNKDPYFLAIKFLYIIKEHETYLSKYKINSKIKLNPINFLFLFFKKIFILLGFIFFSIFRIRNIPTIQNISKTKILILSHYVNNKTTIDYDFYFGKISIDRNKIFRVLHKPILENNDKKKYFYFKKNNIEILYYNLGILKNLKIFFKLLSKSINYHLKHKDIYDDIITLEFLSISTYSNVIFYEYFLEIFQKYNFDKVISTYEGHPFERLFYLASYNKIKNTKKIGYIHTPYSKYQNSAYLDFGKKMNPTNLLTYGNFENFIDKFQFNISYLIYGTTRYFKKNLSLKDFKHNNRKNILFLPDGVDEEIDEFLELAIKLSTNIPKYNFIFRLHPISINKFSKKINKLSFKYKNFHLSDKSIEHDSNKSLLSIYRSSSSIVQSIRNGCLPVYFSIGELSSDPLFELENVIIKIRDIKDALVLIKSNPNKLYDNNDIKKIITHTNLLYNDINNNLLDK